MSVVVRSCHRRKEGRKEGVTQAESIGLVVVIGKERETAVVEDEKGECGDKREKTEHFAKCSTFRLGIA